MAGKATVPREMSDMEHSLRAGFRRDGLTEGIVDSFRRFLAVFAASFRRDLPWRRTADPYRILVSEFMLQQTRVERVKRKYPEFLGRFPALETLARASRQEILSAWQGLGYNRRALALHRTARRIEEEVRGKVPLDRDTLDSFPGVISSGLFTRLSGKTEVIVGTAEGNRVFTL